MAEHAIQVTIGAKDEATKQIKAIDKQLAALTKQKATIAVDLSTDDARKQVAQIDKQMEKLRSDKAEIVVKAKVDQAIKALGDVADEADKAEAAAKALGDALGPELAGADLNRVVAGFRQMGLSLDDITANADRLGGKLRELGSANVGGSLGASLGTARGKTDELRRSADQSRSVLANMVGNTAQDLGQLGGVAGTAGVAIGQLAEYAAEGGIALEGLATAGGPMIGLAATVKLISDVMASTAKATKVAADEQEAWVKALKGGGDAAENYADHLRDVGKIMVQTGDATLSETGSFGAFVSAAGDAGGVFDALGSSLGAFGKGTDDLTESLHLAGINVDIWAKAVTSGADGTEKLKKAMSGANVPAGRQIDILDALAKQQGIYADATAKAAVYNDVFGKSAKEMSKDAQEAIDVLNDLGKSLPRDLEDLANTMEGVQQAADDMAGSFNQMGRASDAMHTAFDFGEAGVNAAEQFNDIQDAMRDLLGFVNDPKGLKGKIPNILSGKDVNAGPFLDKIRSLRAPLQGAITDAFATGGAPAATATANAYVEQLFQAFGAKIKKGDLEELLGLTATIKVAVEQKSLSEAKDLIELVAGIPGADPIWVANVKLALQAGDLTPNAVKLLLADKAKEFGVNIPPKLLPVDPKDLAAAKAAADRFAAQDQNKVGMQTKVASPDAKAVAVAHDGGQVFADKTPIIFPSKVSPPKAIPGFDAGGTVGGYGGIAGERGPEILNRRYLTAGPTFVPPGTQVTSRRRTAVILRTRGTGGLRRYDGGGTVPMGPVTVNFNGVGQVGNRYDLDRQLRKSLNRIERIYGTRG